MAKVLVLIHLAFSLALFSFGIGMVKRMPMKCPIVPTKRPFLEVSSFIRPAHMLPSIEFLVRDL